MMSSLTRHLFLICGMTFATIAFLSPAQAITRRDDVADASYIALASSQTPFLAVGAMALSPTSGADCSATLIAPDWVLTAGHCVRGFTVYSFKINGNTYLADGQYYHPNWTGSLENGNDIALVHLATSVTGVAPALLYQGTNEIGKVGVSVGYGLAGTGVTGYTGGSGVKHAAENRIDGFADAYPVGPSDPPINHNILVSDFDSPSGNGNILGSLGFTSSATPLALEGSIAPGDSGGATFILENNIWQIAGVHSFIAAEASPLGDNNPNSQYNEWYGSTRVSPYMSWIGQTTGISFAVIPEAGTLSLLMLPAAFLWYQRSRKLGR